MKIAVIGAGPTGRTGAYYLARKGYQVDVFEAESKPGGVMAYGIPEYRLPWSIIEHEIDNICRTGVQIHCGKKIEVFGKSTIEEVAAEMGLPVAGRLPVDPAVAAAADSGTFETIRQDALAKAVQLVTSLKKN